MFLVSNDTPLYCKSLRILSLGALAMSFQRLIPKEVIFNSFDRLFTFAGKARSTPWSVDHKWGVTLLQHTQKSWALLGQIRPSASLQHLPDAPHRASHRAWPNERICHHQMGQGLLPLVLSIRSRLNWLGFPAGNLVHAERTYDIYAVYSTAYAQLP